MRSLGLPASSSGLRWEKSRRGQLTMRIDRGRLSLGLEADRASECLSRYPLMARPVGHIDGQDRSGNPRRALRQLLLCVGGP
jgi:hypothetical protein